MYVLITGLERAHSSPLDIHLFIQPLDIYLLIRYLFIQPLDIYSLDIYLFNH